MPAPEWKMWLRIIAGWIVVMVVAMVIAVNLRGCSRQERPPGLRGL